MNAVELREWVDRVLNACSHCEEDTKVISLANELRIVAGNETYILTCDDKPKNGPIDK